MNIIHNISYTCNNNCMFCGIGRNREKTPDLSKYDIEKKLRSAREKGANELIFSGGETTVRPDIIEIMSLSKSLGYEHIEITTNGRMFSYRKFAQKMTEAGLGYVRFSIHGHNSETHDKLTRAPGSFEQAIQGIKNLMEINKKREKQGNPPVQLEITSCINKINYKHVDEMVKFFNNFNLTHLDTNYIIPWSAAEIYFHQLVPKYSEAVPYIKRAIDKNSERKVKITKVANIPVCFMVRYEKYKSELHEKYIEIINPTGKPFSYSGHRSKQKVKPKKCKKCRYVNVCEGIYPQYSKRYGFNEIEPVKGELITKENFKEFIEKVDRTQ